MSAIIQVKDLSRDFADIKAVDRLSFTVNTGEVYGFLGQNGAGKSTTIRMLLTLIQPTEGTIEIMGYNLNEHRKKILQRTGAIVERPDLYKYLTAMENLRMFAALSGVKVSARQLKEKLELVGLGERADSKVKTYSQGMKQRLGIAVALVHDPDLVILDEPLNGLDPQGIADVRKLILHMSRDLGKTVFVSSHLLGEMELIADSMLIINKGKKVAEGRKEELLNPVRTQVELVTSDHKATLALLKHSVWESKLLEPLNGALLFEMDKTDIPELNRFLVEKGVPVLSLRPKHSLEDFFLSLTAH
jgi:ABC-type multidrug transport system ATPase subunit